MNQLIFQLETRHNSWLFVVIPIHIVVTQMHDTRGLGVYLLTPQGPSAFNKHSDSDAMYQFVQERTLQLVTRFVLNFYCWLYCFCL